MEQNFINIFKFKKKTVRKERKEGMSFKNLLYTHINIILIPSIPYSDSHPDAHLPSFSSTTTTHTYLTLRTSLLTASRASREPACTSASRNRLPGFTRSQKRRWMCSRCGTCLETWVLTCDTIVTVHPTTPPPDLTVCCYGGDSRCASLSTLCVGRREGERGRENI